MRILYFTQFFAPENIAAAFRAAEHAGYWARGGHDVTVFTGWPNYPTGELFDGYTVAPLGEEIVGNVRLFRSQSKIQSNTSFKKRVESGISFVVNGFKNLGPESPVGTEYDVVLVTCGTVFAAWLGVRYAKRHKLPLVVEFRDLTYKQMIATGSSEKSAKVRAMRSLELSFCKVADHIVVLTKGFMDDLVSEGVSRTRISIVPNGADVVPCEHKWGSSLRLGYFGTMGLSQDVPTTLDYAAKLAGKGLVTTYLLVGEGASRAEVERAMTSGSFDFVKLLHGMPKDELERHYAAIDMTVVSIRKSEDFAGTIPSKIFQSFARGVPVLFIGPEGDASRLVRDSGAGIALCGSGSEDIARLIEFASQPNLELMLQKMKDSAIDFMERYYTRRRMAEQMLEALARVVRK